MSNPETVTPVVHLDELIPDRCNYADQTFRNAVARFFERNMPGFPMGLLDTDNAERWEIQSDADALPLEIEVSTDAAGVPTVTLDLDGCAAILSEREQDEIREWIASEIADPDPGEAEGHTLYLAIVGGELVSIHDDEDEAREAAQEREEEGRFGFPWANGHAFLPDSCISDGDLKAAGFVVATYYGGGGDNPQREGEEFRLCGIDGGGYSFDGQHYGPLYAIVAERRGWTVPTDKGDCYVSTAPRVVS